MNVMGLTTSTLTNWLVHARYRRCRNATDPPLDHEKFDPPRANVKQIAAQVPQKLKGTFEIHCNSTAPMSGDHDSITVTAKPKEVAPFLKSLRQMLDSENPAILRWMPDGKAFEIHDMDAMMRLVLPKYFKHGKYTSFQRQLNYFSFRKWTKSKAVVCTFSNPFFQRDQPALAWRITRKKSLHSIDKSPKSGSTKVQAKAQKSTQPPKPIVIKLPSREASNPASLSSPTDAYSLANTLDLRNMYGEVSEITFHDPLSGLLDDYSLDWVDVLYSSLEPQTNSTAHPSFRDHAFDYTEL